MSCVYIVSVTHTLCTFIHCSSPEPTRPDSQVLPHASLKQVLKVRVLSNVEHRCSLVSLCCCSPSGLREQSSTADYETPHKSKQQYISLQADAHLTSHEKQLQLNIYEAPPLLPPPSLSHKPKKSLLILK